MRILYVGWLNRGSTSQERADALAGLGHEILPFDMLMRLPGANKVEQTLMGRYGFGPRISETNKLLLEMAHKTSFDIVWVDKGIWLYAEVLAELRQLSVRKLAVHYTPDAQIHDNRMRHYIRAIPNYDIHVTTKPFEVEPLKALGARAVQLVLQGYGAKFGRATKALIRDDLRSDICFIGHSQRHYRSIAKHLAKTDVDFKIWGPNWPRWARVSPALRPLVKGSGLWGDDYPAALLSAKIALTLLSKYIPETTTTRTFEIPATGAFMLAERTDDHLALFEEDKEAAYFGSREELTEKLKFYLANDALRETIAAAGRARSVRDNYDLPSQLKSVLAFVELA